MFAAIVESDNGLQSNILSNVLVTLDDDGRLSNAFTISAERDDGKTYGEITFDDFRHLINFSKALNKMIKAWKAKEKYRINNPKI